MIDPWEYQYLVDQPNQNLICWDDESAFNTYKDFAWVYDKCLINNLFNEEEAIDLEYELPASYPVFVKPKINLVGMGEGAYVARSRKAIKNRKGYVAQPFYEGEHLSTDFVVMDGQVVDWYSFIGHKDHRGSFKLFASVNYVAPRALKVAKTLGFNGLMNVETIGGNIIEIHLRPSLQFFDICGGLIPNYLRSGGKKSAYKKSKFSKTYSRVYRTKKDRKICIKPQLFCPEGVSSVQLTYYPEWPLSQCENDMMSYRVLVVNGTDLTKVEAYGKIVYKFLMGE